MKKTLSIILLVLVSTHFNSVVAQSPTANISKEKAAQIAQTRFQGKIIAVTPNKKSNSVNYQVKILDKQGGMHVVIINGQNGQVISAH